MHLKHENLRIFQIQRLVRIKWNFDLINLFRINQINRVQPVAKFSKKVNLLDPLSLYRIVKHWCSVVKPSIILTVKLSEESSGSKKNY